MLAFQNALAAWVGALGLGGLLLSRPEYRHLRQSLTGTVDRDARPALRTSAAQAALFRGKDVARILIGIGLILGFGLVLWQVTSNGLVALFGAAALTVWLATRNRYRRTVLALIGKRRNRRSGFSGYWEE